MSKTAQTKIQKEGVKQKDTLSTAMTGEQKMCFSLADSMAWVTSVAFSFFAPQFPTHLTSSAIIKTEHVTS